MASSSILPGVVNQVVAGTTSGGQNITAKGNADNSSTCLLYTSPSPRD